MYVRLRKGYLTAKNIAWLFNIVYTFLYSAFMRHGTFAIFLSI